MGVVVEFAKFRPKQKVSDAERLKALVKGNIREFTCDTCGGDIEVINNKFPKKCPCCGVDIEFWDEDNK